MRFFAFISTFAVVGMAAASAIDTRKLLLAPVVLALFRTIF